MRLTGERRRNLMLLPTFVKNSAQWAALLGGHDHETFGAHGDKSIKAHAARFGISLIGLLGAFIIFMTTDDVGWLSIAACFVVVIVAFIVGEMVFRRLADPETRRRDLEERAKEPL